jgi:uncharacterized Tic20 family protein
MPVSAFPFMMIHGVVLLFLIGCVVASGALLARYRHAGYGLALAGFIALLLQSGLAMASSFLPLYFGHAMPVARIGVILGMTGSVGSALKVAGLVLLLAGLIRLRPAQGESVQAAARPEVAVEGTGLAGLAHLGILFSLVGVLLAIVIYVSQTDRTSFTARHAKQAFVYQIAVSILGFAASFLLALLSVGSIVTGMMPMAFMMGPALLIVFAGIGMVIYGIYAAIAAFSGREFRYAVIGDWAERL